MNSRMSDDVSNQFKDEINWEAYKDQGMPKSSSNTNSENIRIGVKPNEKQGEMADTFLGRLQKPSFKEFFSPERVKEAVSEGAGALSGINAVGYGEKGIGLAKKGLEYINPENISKELLGKIGEGTIPENIEQLGKRVKFGKESAKEEALLPKHEFMEEAKGKNITRLKPEKVDIKNVASIFEKDENEFTPERMKLIKKSINNYYKHGDIEQLAEEGSEIFESPELSEKSLSKLESFVPIEKLNRGKYLSDTDAIKFYSPKGELSNAHNEFIKTKSVESADKLMSELKGEIRELKSRQKKGTLGDIGDAKLSSYESNLQNLKNDWGKFIKILPKELQGKYADFAKKYAINVAPYEDAGFIVRKLATGDTKGILPESLDRLFANPNPKKEVMKVIDDIGTSGWNNLVYNMLSKYKPGDVKGMAQAILEGRRKGSPIITDEMVNAANYALKRGKISSLVKSTAGAALGGIAGMPFGIGALGSTIGAITPYALANKDIIAKMVTKIKR